MPLVCPSPVPFARPKPVPFICPSPVPFARPKPAPFICQKPVPFVCSKPVHFTMTRTWPSVFAYQTAPNRLPFACAFHNDQGFAFWCRIRRLQITSPLPVPFTMTRLLLSVFACHQAASKLAPVLDLPQTCAYCCNQAPPFCSADQAALIFAPAFCI